jgi:SAM-dependent MidA family methyltransferase
MGQTPNAQRRTSNLQNRPSPSLDVRRSALDVFWLSSELVQFIHDTIQARGPQPFAWFMQRALYHPEHGYYSSGRGAIGRCGDYFTNVSVGPVFGQLLAAQFAEIWERLDKIDNFIIVEQGAHHGQFARDVLESARKSFPEFFEALRYRIIEPFPALQDRQSQTLEGRPPCRPKNSGTGQSPSLQDFRAKVQWQTSLTPFVGVHFSNELLDAMPVNLRGKRVGLDGDEFVFVEAPDNPQEKPNQAALDWINSVAATLERGFVMIVDYGRPRSQFRESLQVRMQHRELDSPFEKIGHADITMPVNWTDIAERAEANGLRVAGFTDQHHFLTGIISEFPEIANDPQSKRALQTLLHPEMLGRAFQVLMFSKEIDPVERLCGFKFARDPRPPLEL